MVGRGGASPARRSPRGVSRSRRWPCRRPASRARPRRHTPRSSAQCSRIASSARLCRGSMRTTPSRAIRSASAGRASPAATRSRRARRASRRPREAARWRRPSRWPGFASTRRSRSESGRKSARVAEPNATRRRRPWRRTRARNRRPLGTAMPSCRRPRSRSVLVAVPGPVGERAVHGPGQHPHPERPAAGEPSASRGSRSWTCRGARRGTGVQGQGGEGARRSASSAGSAKRRITRMARLLVGRRRTRPPDSRGPGWPAPRQARPSRGRSERPPSRAPRVRQRREPAVACSMRPSSCSTCRGDRSALENGIARIFGDLGRAQALRPLRQRNERTQPVFGRESTAHGRIMTRTA